MSLKKIGKAIVWLAVSAVTLLVVFVIYIMASSGNRSSPPIQTNSGHLETLLKSFPLGTDIETVRSAVIRGGYYVLNTVGGKDTGSVTFSESACDWPSFQHVVSYEKRKTEPTGVELGPVGMDCMNSSEIFERVKAESGDKKAQYYFACLYTQGTALDENGCDVTSPNLEEALKWWRKLAEGGDEPAQLFLGYLYSQGKYVKQDYAAAYFWFGLAAKSGDKDILWLRDNAGENLSAEQTAIMDKRIQEWKLK